MTHSLDAFHQAISAYRGKTVSYVEASTKFGVPQITIRKHKNNTNNHVKSGRPSLLPNNQEEYLVALLEELHSAGVRLTKETLSKISGDFMKKVKNNENLGKSILFVCHKASLVYVGNPGRHWFDKFFKRNSDKLKMKF